MPSMEWAGALVTASDCRGSIKWQWIQDRVWSGWVENRVEGCIFLPRTYKENVAQKPGIIMFSPYKWSVQNSTCFQEGVFVLHQITLCYEYVLITFTPLHFYKCKGVYFVISREVPFLRLASFCHMVILFFTPSLFHIFSLEIMLTAVQFLPTCVYNVLGRALIILYILTIILVGVSHGVDGEGGIYWQHTHICVFIWNRKLLLWVLHHVCHFALQKHLFSSSFVSQTKLFV